MLGSVCRFGWLAPALISGSVLLPVGQTPARAQFYTSRFDLSDAVSLDVAESSARTHLERVKACLADEQWDEAVETLRLVMENHGSKVIELAAGRYVSVRDFCHLRISALPPPALDLYRNRVDAQARQWYEQAIATRDRALLLRIVDLLFASSYADQAPFALGEISLEQGDYAAARGYWEKLIESAQDYSPIPGRVFEQARHAEGLPDEDAMLLDRWYQPRGTADTLTYQLFHKAARPDEIDRQAARFWKARGVLPKRLAYPETDLKLADIRARMVLASILEGSTERAAGELPAFNDLHPAATGKIGGRTGPYAELLGSLLEASESWPTAIVRPTWQSFAGDFERNFVGPRTLELGELKWQKTLDKTEVTDSQARSYGFSPRRVAEDDKGLLSYHPLVVGNTVVGNTVLIAHTNRILAFDLHSGEPAWGHKDGVIYRSEDDGAARPQVRHSSLGTPRFTLTVHGNKLLARIGSPVTASAVESPFTSSTATLVCLDLAAQGRLLWQLSLKDEPKWAFEGAPVVDGANVYIAMRRSDIRPQAHVACFDAETGRRRWRRFVCSAETPGRGQMDEITHNLLTLHRDTLYYNTNLGAVAVLATRDGEFRWISLYPRADGGDLSRQAKHFYRDLNPCIYDRGRLFIAPSDAVEITALDAQTGDLLWRTDGHPEDAVHLLGVSGNTLVASGDKLWFFYAGDGKLKSFWPDTGSGPPRGFGRGVLAGDEVLWPTREELYRFNLGTCQRTGSVRLVDRGAMGGNLVVAGDHLLIAAGETLYAFDIDGAQRAGTEVKPITVRATP